MEILQDFGVEPALLIAQTINFLVLLVILRFIAYKPIIKMLDERKKRIAESMAQSKQIEDRFEKLDDEVKTELKRARAEADKVLAEAKQMAQQVVAETQTQSKTHAESIVAIAEVAAKQEFEESRAQLKREVISLAITAAEKATRDVLTQEQKKRLTEDAAKELAS